MPNIDLQKFNPDWEIAKHHGESCRPGMPDDIAEGQIKPHRLCECCLNPIDKTPVPLCENTKQLEFLGFGFPLYFFFLKQILILLFLLMMSYSIIGVVWAVEDNYGFCKLGETREISNHEVTCTSWMVYVARLEWYVTDYEIVLRCTFFILHFFALLYIRDSIRKTYAYHDERDTSLSDFAIVIENIPEQKGLSKKLKEFFQSYFGKPMQVPEIILLNYLNQYYEVRDNKLHLLQQRRALMYDMEGNKDAIKRIDGEIEAVKEQIKNIDRKEHALIAVDQVECDSAIVICETDEIKETILKQFERSDKTKLAKYFDGDVSDMQMVQAPDPKEIIWENLHFPKRKKLVRVILAWGAFILTVAVVTVAFYFILEAKELAVKAAKEQMAKNNESGGETVLAGAVAGVYLSLILIIFFNKFILAKLLHIYTDWQRKNTGSGFEFSFALKYAIGLFFTTALMTLLVEDIRFNNIYTENYGVVEEETIMFFFSGFLVPLLWLINPWAIYSKIRQWYYYGRPDFTQGEANEIMQPTTYSLGKKYAEIIESIWFTFLYASIIPLGSGIMFFGLVFYFWVDKYNLLRRSSIAENISGHVSLRMMKLLDITLMLKPAGELIFDRQIREKIQVESIVLTCIGFVYLFMPWDRILELAVDEKFFLESRKYSDIKNAFIQTYVTLHPLFSRDRKTTILGSGRNMVFLESQHHIAAELKM